MADKVGDKFIDAGTAESEQFEADEEVQAEFAEAQHLASGNRILTPEQRKHPSRIPEEAPSHIDADADWRRSDTGEEAVGGSAPTPDQDVVEEIGVAVGLTYEDNEPLDTTEKLAERDRHRWELDPASSEDYNDRVNREGE